MTLFFALYTYGDSFDNKLTLAFGYFLFGLFHVANITVIL